MVVRWFGQSAFLLRGSKSILIDPFGPLGARAAARGIELRYPPVEGLEADLVLVTHEHRDHNHVEAVVGEPPVIRSTAGTLPSPVGEVLAIASEHDDRAGTARGPNTIFCFTLDGLRVCHLGDFGQARLRPAQQDAISAVDVLFVPVGGGPTIGGAAAADLVRTLAPRLVVPMHYRTDAATFLDPPDEFLDALGVDVTRAGSAEVDLSGILAKIGEPGVLLLDPPVA